MTKIELAKPTQQQPVPHQFGMFEEIRNEMNRVLERFESGWPRWTSLAPLPPLRWPTSLMVPEGMLKITVPETRGCEGRAQDRNQELTDRQGWGGVFGTALAASLSQAGPA